MLKKLSIVIINFNSTKHTINSLISIYNVVQEDLDFEIILVDNASNNDQLNLLEDYLKTAKNNNLTFISSKINLGFSGGNMLGAREAIGSFIAFVNNDTIFHENSFSILIDYYEKNENIGVITCLSKNVDGVDFCSFDHFIGIRKSFLGRFILESIFNKPKRKKKIMKPITVDAVQGCFMLFRKNVFSQVGGYDTNLFLYYEEIDICKRLKTIGYSSVFFPNTYFTHLQGGSTKCSILMKEELLISFLYVLKKNFGNFRYYIISSLLLLKYSVKTIFNSKYKRIIKIILSNDKFKYSLKNM